MAETYGATAPRRTEAFTIKKLDEREGYYDVTTTDSGGFMLKVENLARPLAEGGSYTLECVRYSEVVGVADAYGWLWRMTDDDIEDRHRKYVEDADRRRRESYEANRHDWERRSAELPTWLQARLRRFHDAAGEKFAIEGWGYELAVCELAWAYYDEDEERVERIARELGTSGNQHDVARLLARLQREGGDFTPAEVPSALAPLTGSADYRG